jgi:ABC-type multidrug transport system ATPase subunit
MYALKVNGLSLRYGRQLVLNRISFAFEQGKITGLLGPNGAGKSSIMKILAGLVYPDTGTLEKNGAKLADFSRLRDSCAFMIDSPSFYPFLSGRQNLELICRILGKKVNLEELLTEVGLDPGSTKRVRNYSTGMKQRLAIAQAMVGDADLLILDEPFNGLDPNGFQDVILLLKGLNAKGKTIVVSSHLLNELEQFADAFILLHKGNVALDIDKSSLLKTKKKVKFTFEQELTEEHLKFLDREGQIGHKRLTAVLELSPKEIAPTVERLVAMKAVPVNVETQNLLQEKYLEITA